MFNAYKPGQSSLPPLSSVSLPQPTDSATTPANANSPKAEPLTVKDLQAKYLAAEYEGEKAFWDKVKGLDTTPALPSPSLGQFAGVKFVYG